LFVQSAGGGEDEATWGVMSQNWANVSEGNGKPRSQCVAASGSRPGEMGCVLPTDRVGFAWRWEVGILGRRVSVDSEGGADDAGRAAARGLLFLVSRG
jgi:hypothetical protein